MSCCLAPDSAFILVYRIPFLTSLMPNHLRLDIDSQIGEVWINSYLFPEENLILFLSLLGVDTPMELE